MDETQWKYTIWLVALFMGKVSLQMQGFAAII